MWRPGILARSLPCTAPWLSRQRDGGQVARQVRLGRAWYGAATAREERPATGVQEQDSTHREGPQRMGTWINEDGNWNAHARVAKYSPDQVAWATQRMGYEPDGARLSLLF